MNKKKELDFYIYPVITESFCKNGSAIETLKQLIKANIKIVQLREKITDNKNRKDILNLAYEFRKLTYDNNILLIINDYIDIALEINADGVHLGPEDLPVNTARELAPNLIIGASAYSIEDALILQKQSIDYVNMGSVFSTKTKQLKNPPIGLDGIKKAKQLLHIPFTVIGGIKEENLESVVKAGAYKIAMITQITMADNIVEKINSMRNIIINTIKNC